MIYLLLILYLITTSKSTPPSCFLSCISEISKINCSNNLSNLGCICLNEDQIVGCLIDICPYGTFNSARDHFLGTCLEHGKPSITNPYPPPASWPPKDYLENLPKIEESPPINHQTQSSLAPLYEQPIQENPPPVYQSPAPVPPVPEPQIQPQIPERIPPQQEPEHGRERSPPPFPSPPPDVRPELPPIPQNRESAHSIKEDDNSIDSDPWFNPGRHDAYDPNKPIEWEEIDTLDEHGDFIVVKKPINVPPKLRDKSKIGNSRRVTIEQPSSNQQQHQSNFYKSNNGKQRFNDNFRNSNNNKYLFKTNRIIESLQPKGTKLYRFKNRKNQPRQPPSKSSKVTQVSRKMNPSIPKHPILN
ncbi:uncharacterized protein KGF55_002226 [Candida pseudojiufengensis]|uniref:uncharacterized protein n=1 Tax=Candida pseudojiufengensis TaxID=497109 RepID=UPI0022258303|nr:uncharacterized protein KGF55_002226 [Candida pseudojiufengensis]KAI5964284.1 hypothetical protein KGF55_002226 [Candida pseudojiufengensis]